MEEDGDFTACRFDFRIDNKNGLTPSRRKKAERRQVNYNTLFKCKVCGSLFESRPSLLAHKLIHSEFKCEHCSDTFQRKSIWRLHVTKVHGIQAEPTNVKKPSSGSVAKSVRNLLPTEETVNKEPAENVKTPSEQEVKKEMSLSPTPPPLIPPPVPDMSLASSPLIPPTPPAQSIAPPTQDLPSTPLTSPCNIISSTPNIPGFVCINVPIFITSGDGSNTTVTALPPGPNPQGATLMPNMAAMPQGAVLMHQPFAAPVTSAAMIPLLAPPPGTGQPHTPSTLHYKPQAPPTVSQATPTMTQAPPLIHAEDLEPGEIRGSKDKVPVSYAGHHNVPSVTSSVSATTGHHNVPSVTSSVSATTVPSQPPNMAMFQVPPSKQITCQTSHGQHTEVTPKTTSTNGRAPADPIDQYVIDLSVKKSAISENGNKDTGSGNHKLQADSPHALYDDDKQAMQEQYNLTREPRDTPTNSGSSSTCSTPSPLQTGKAGSKKKFGGLSKMVEKLWQNKIGRGDNGQKDPPAVSTAASVTHKPTAADVIAMEMAMSSLPKPMKVQPQTPSIPVSPFIKRPVFSSNVAMEKNVLPSNVTMERNASVELELVKGEQTYFSDARLDTIMSDKQDLHVTENPSPVIEVPHAPHAPYMPDYNSFMEFEPKEKTDTSFCTLKFHTCPVCRQLFSSSEAMRTHMKNDHATKRLTNRTRAPKPRPSRARLHCPSCAFTTTSLFALKHHRITAHPDAFGSTTPVGPDPPAKETRIKCRFPGCGRAFKELRHLRVHQTLHTSEKPLSCSLCSYSCRLRGSLHWHMKNRHNVDRVKGHGDRMVYVDQNGVVIGSAHDDDEGMEEESLETPDVPMETNENEAAVYSQTTANNVPPITITPMDTDGDAPLDMSKKVKADSPVRVVQPKATSPKQKEDKVKVPVSQGQGELSVYKIEASPGPDPKYYTSVMKFNFKGTGSKAAAAAAAQDLKKCVCKACNMAFDDAEAMWRHKLDAHADDTRFHCDTCAYFTLSRAELQSHMMSTHGQEMGEHKEYMCFICTKGYASRNGLHHHLLRHCEEGPPGYNCPHAGCTSRLLSKSALKNHIRRAHNKPKTPAPPVSDTADSPQSQNGDDRLLVCGYHGCDRTFRESKHLKVHRMQHTDEKPLKCELCFYSCRQRNSMNWHMKSKHAMDKQVTPDGRTIYVSHE